MPLSDSQKSKNKAEFDKFLKLHALTFDLTNLPHVEAVFLAACTQSEMVFNALFPEGAESLLKLLSPLSKETTINLENLKTALASWSLAYRQTEAKAGEVARQLHLEQPKGILQSLDAKQEALAEIWCDEKDLRACLHHYLCESSAITKGGTYILTPVSIEDSGDELAQHLSNVLLNNILSPLKLLIPLNDGTHWRLAIIKLDENTLVSATLWDSMSNSKLAQSFSFKMMKEALEQAFALTDSASIDIATKLKAEAIGIQASNNFWVCGYFVIQQCLKEMPMLKNNLAIQLRDTPEWNTKALNQAVIDMISAYQSSLSCKRNDKGDEKAEMGITQKNTFVVS